MTTTITTADDHYTLVNVFHVEPSRQQELYEHLRDVTEDTIRHLPGFVSANLHLARDGKSVVNYAQWKSHEQFRAMHADPRLAEHFEYCRSVSTPQSIHCALAYVEGGEATAPADTD